MDRDSLAYSNSSHSTIVQALCRDLLDHDINLNISEADEMLLFFLYAQGNTFDQAVALYLDSGRHIWATLRHISSRGGSARWSGAVTSRISQADTAGLRGISFKTCRESRYGFPISMPRASPFNSESSEFMGLFRRRIRPTSSAMFPLTVSWSRLSSLICRSLRLLRGSAGSDRS